MHAHIATPSCASHLSIFPSRAAHIRATIIHLRLYLFGEAQGLSLGSLSFSAFFLSRLRASERMRHCVSVTSSLCMPDVSGFFSCPLFRRKWHFFFVIADRLVAGGNEGFDHYMVEERG